jgi:hypothetical protein
MRRSAPWGCMVVGNAFTLALPVSCFNPQWTFSWRLFSPNDL